MLLKTRDKGTRSVVLTIGESKVPAKLLAANLLPNKLNVLSKIQKDVDDLILENTKIERDIGLLDKKYRAQLANDSVSVQAASQTKSEIESLEDGRKAGTGKVQAVIDQIEDWLLETITEIDLVKPVEGLSEAELDDLADLEAKGELSKDDGRVEKVKFSRETMREMMSDPRAEGIVSFVPLTLFKIVVESTKVGEASGSN